MANSRVQQHLPNATATDVWAVVGNFGDMSWHPFITECTLAEDGKSRTLKMVNGATLVQNLIGQDDAAMQYRYGISEPGRLPVRGFVGTVTVQNLNGAMYTSEADFDAPKGVDVAAAKGAIDGILDAGLAELAKRFGG
ncbi:MAG: hypothetical protein ACI9MR_002288 [Myxococcota bacterium]|jgi:hypothetical protein